MKNPDFGKNPSGISNEEVFQCTVVSSSWAFPARARPFEVTGGCPPQHLGCPRGRKLCDRPSTTTFPMAAQRKAGEIKPPPGGFPANFLPDFRNSPAPNEPGASNPRPRRVLLRGTSSNARRPSGSTAKPCGNPLVFSCVKISRNQISLTIAKKPPGDYTYAVTGSGSSRGGFPSDGSSTAEVEDRDREGPAGGDPPSISATKGRRGS